MILERTAHEMDAVGDQRRGQRVAGKALIDAAIEAELDRRAAIDAAALGHAKRIGHHIASGRGWPAL